MIIYDFHTFLFHVFFFFFSNVRIRFSQESDGEKSEQDLVVDIANETVSFPLYTTNNDTLSLTHTQKRKIKLFVTDSVLCTVRLQVHKLS